MFAFITVILQNMAWLGRKVPLIPFNLFSVRQIREGMIISIKIGIESSHD